MEQARISGPTSIPVSDYSAIVDKAVPRHDSLGVGIDQSASIWRALDRAAVAVVGSGTLPERGRAEKLTNQVAAAIAMVRKAARRMSDGNATETMPLDREVLDSLRKEFLRELHTETNIDGRRLVRVLSAFETVAARQTVLRKPKPNLMGLEALVEVAHDMRSPLTSILFLVDAIRTAKSGPVTTVQERQLGLIYGAALGLSTLASDLIDLVRGGGSLVEGNPAPFSIAETLCGVKDLVTPIAEEKGLELACQAPCIDGRVGYAAAISRVLLNLTTNAVKFTESGSVRIECIEVGQTRLHFSVTDSGRGLPQDVRRSLFSPFTHTRGRMRFSNSGLGLSICRSLLAAMSSELRVETCTDLGSRFSFELELPVANVANRLLSGN